MVDGAQNLKVLRPVNVITITSGLLDLKKKSEIPMLTLSLKM